MEERVLIHIPARHNRADGNNEQLSEKYWQLVEKYWNHVEDAVNRLEIANWNKVKIFSDSVCEVSELLWQIITDLAEKGSRHTQLILTLYNRGAQLCVTEDKDLFLSQKWSVKNRDPKIAQYINAQLLPGEIGILILGQSHTEWRFHLDQDIKVCLIFSEEDLANLRKEITEARTGR